MARARARATRDTRRVSHILLAALAAAGVILSVYLTWTRAAHAPVYCPLGSGCDVVQSSRFAALFGIPVALLGVLYYGALLVLALRPMDPAARWNAGTPLAFAGVAASLVFTVVQQVQIRATCSLCLVSAALTVVILLVFVLRRPDIRLARTWTWATVAALGTVVLFAGGYAVSAPRAGAQDYTEGLARHLASSGVKFYGAYWCPHCADQKAMFGRAASLLPYIECDQRSPIGQPAVCAAVGIRAFPTWDIAGQRIEGVVPLSDLARLSGYPPPP